MGPMRFDPQAGITWLASQFASRRAHPRLHQETLISSIGPVVDLSLGGARVLARRAHHGRMEFRIMDRHCAIVLDAEVMWSQRLGFRRHEIGVRFLNVSPDVSAAIGRLATDNRYRRVVDCA